jgi:transposase
MDRYVGIDSHSKSCTLGILSASGKRLRSLVVETNGRTIVEAVRLIPGRVHVCLEEGAQSAWLYELLRPHAAEVVVTVPPKASGAKDDQRDAWSRAEELRVGAIKSPVYKTAPHLAGLRAAVRAHTFAVSDVVRAKNRYRSVFLSRGLVVDSSVYEPEQRARWLAKLGPPYQHLAELLGRQLDQVTPARVEAERWLHTESKAHPIIKKLSTAPGMGPIRTAQVVAIVGTPERFRARQQFWSYCGLSIETRSSADWRPGRDGRMERVQTRTTRGLTKRKQPLLKSVFKGAAKTVITQLPEDPLHAHYQRMIDKGIKPALARLTIARRIAATVLSMWRHQEVYDPTKALPHES